MRTVCEVVVQDILPTLRAAIAKELIVSYNMNQGEVAKLLGVSQPAVSQYLRQLRGKNAMLEHETVLSEVKEISGKLHSKQIGHKELASKMCSISRLVIDNGILNVAVHGRESCDSCQN